MCILCTYTTGVDLNHLVRELHKTVKVAAHTVDT